MAHGSIHPAERLATHAVLWLGCVAFAFPFVWMLMTSFKIPTEMDLDRLQLLPKPPRPQLASPYIDVTAFTNLDKPDGVPDAVWQKALPRLTELLRGRVAAWAPHLTNVASADAPALPDREAYLRTMTDGLLINLQSRLSDPSRLRAVEVAREAWLRDHGPQAAVPDDAELASKLDEPAIEAGVQALLSETATLVDDVLLTQVFERCYRRVCLAGLRVRSTDYQLHDLGDAPDWRREQGPAELMPRRDGSLLAQEVRMRFTGDQTAVVFTCAPPLGGLDLKAIDRIYVRFRGDSSWARVTLEVICQGQVFRTEERMSLSDREWYEQELRWPGGEGSPLERRTYRMLKLVGAAPAGSPEFMVRLAIHKNSWLGAWRDKVTNNYIAAFREVPYARFLMTSFSLVILNILLSIISCTLVGYAFSRLEWPGRELCFAVLLATMMLPGQVTMIPAFLIVKQLGWFNTLLPLWVPAAFGTPFFIFLFRQFFKNIPADLEDAARIDGCGFLRIYWHVMLPLVKPTIATVAIFTFMGTWNNFMGPLIYLNNEHLYPLALGLFKFNLRNGGDIGLMMAGSLVMTLPIILLFFFVQRYFIQGISLSGTKA